MKKVIDANFLRHPTLEDDLGKDLQNHVVCTDYACMECYKGNALEHIRRSLESVAKDPEQVIVLKGTCESIRLQANGHQLPANLVDSQQTDAFRDVCRHVRTALQGDVEFRSQLRDLGNMANAHFNHLRNDALGVAHAMRPIAQSFLPGQLAELRGRRALSKQTGDVIVQNILSLAALLFNAHPEVPNLPTADTRRDTFVFRFALAAQLLVVRWLRDGGIESVGMDRRRNDVVEMTYVAYAT